MKSPVIPHFSAAQLNEIRRSLLEKLESVLELSYQRVERPLVKTSHPYPLSAIDYNGNIANEKAKAFYQRHGAELVRWAPEKWGYRGGEALMTTKFCMRYAMGWCKIHQHPTVEVPEQLFLTREHQRLRLEFDCRKCMMKVIKDVD
jgi:putative protease